MFDLLNLCRKVSDWLYRKVKSNLFFFSLFWSLKVAQKGLFLNKAFPVNLLMWQILLKKNVLNFLPTFLLSSLHSYSYQKPLEYVLCSKSIFFDHHLGFDDICQRVWEIRCENIFLNNCEYAPFTIQYNFCCQSIYLWSQNSLS